LFKFSLSTGTLLNRELVGNRGERGVVGERRGRGGKGGGVVVRRNCRGAKDESPSLTQLKKSNNNNVGIRVFHLEPMNPRRRRLLWRREEEGRGLRRQTMGVKNRKKTGRDDRGKTSKSSREFNIGKAWFHEIFIFWESERGPKKKTEKLFLAKKEAAE